ncbi:MAG: UPF0182 family protein, partial [Ferruginibacter sp.]
MMSNAAPKFNFKRRRGPLPITIGILVVIGVVLVSLSGFYADWLWFKSVNFTSVWSTVLMTKVALFVAAGLITATVVLLNIIIAYKKRPLYVPMTVEADNLERYRGQIEPIKRLVIAGLAVALFYFAGTSGSMLWSTWLLFKNSTSFGVTDPQFHMDISFFAFRLPFWQTLI